MFNCYAHPSGGSSIRSKPQMICFGPAWVTRVLPSTAVLILLTLAIYTLFVILACYAARMKKEHTHSITFIWGRFRPEAYYWGIPFITRNLFIAIAPALSQNPFIVATLINSSLLIYLYYLLRFWPWKTPLQNVADAVVVLSLNITVATGAFFARNHTFPYSEDQETFAWFFLRIAATFPIIGAFVACAVVLALGCLESKRKPRQKLVNKVWVPRLPFKPRRKILILKSCTVVTSQASFARCGCDADFSCSPCCDFFTSNAFASVRRGAGHVCRRHH